MQKSIFLAVVLLATFFSSMPAHAQASAAVTVNSGPVTATVSTVSAEPTFLQPVQTVNPTSFLSATTTTTGQFGMHTTGQTVAPMPDVSATGVQGAATTGFTGSALSAASQGNENNSDNLATGSQGIPASQNLNDKTTQQLSGPMGTLNLPRAGTMGLAPVFGTGHDGLTSPGGYVPALQIPYLNIQFNNGGVNVGVNIP